MVLICLINSLVTEATLHELKVLNLYYYISMRSHPGVKKMNVYYYICIEFIIKEILMVSICLIGLLVTEATSHESKILDMCIIIHVLNL